MIVLEPNSLILYPTSSLCLQMQLLNPDFGIWKISSNVDLRNQTWCRWGLFWQYQRTKVLIDSAIFFLFFFWNSHDFFKIESYNMRTYLEICL